MFVKAIKTVPQKFCAIKFSPALPAAPAVRSIAA